MNDAKVQREAALPLYYQIYKGLRDEILSGALPLGASVPTELEISERFGVSRITARRAMQELSDVGLVERRRRTGTRVIHRTTPAIRVEDPERTIDTLIAFGHETVVTILSYDRVPASADAAGALSVEPGTELIRIVRLRSSAGRPLGVIESILPLEAETFVTADRLRDTPLLQLLRESGAPISQGEQLISAAGAGLSLAQHLDLEPQAPVLRIERLLRTTDEKPIARTVAHYRGDRYRIALGLEAVPHPLVEAAVPKPA